MEHTKNHLFRSGISYSFILFVILSTFLAIFAVFCSPYRACADSGDVIAPSHAPATFESLQNLTLSASINGAALQDLSSTTMPLGSRITLSYTIGHSSIWPSHSPSADNNQLFTETLSEQKLYLELWRGIPFTSTSTMLQSLDISGKSSGQVSLTIPQAGPYFVVAYFPDGFFQNPEAMCPNDDNWQEDCAPPSTLAQVEGYFNYLLTSYSDYPYMPDAFGGLQFTVSASSTPPAVFKSSNILFLPGIEGSRLYMRDASGKEQSLWEPSLLNGLTNLTLNADGSSQKQVYTRDLVDYIYGQKALGDVYGPFENFLNGLVQNGSLQKWQAFPYDWRLDVNDLVKNGTLIGQSTGALTRVYPEKVLQELASSSPSGKVTIIAHSNGGLLAKALLQYISQKGEAHLVDRVILVGSPEYGTPLTIGSLLNGDGQTDAGGGLVMYGGTVREVAATMPGMYGLLPSSAYFAHDLDVPVLFPGTTSSDLYAKKYGPSISSFMQLSSFLTDAFGLHSNFAADDERTPQVLSGNILAKESAMHANLDAWQPSAGISLYTISGWGNPTPYQYSYTVTSGKQLSCFRSGTLNIQCSYSLQVKHVAKNTDSGDNTVVTSSASVHAVTDGSQTYFNAKSFAQDKKGKIGHGNLMSAEPIQSYIKNILTNENEDASTSANRSIPYLSSTMPSGGSNPLTVVSVHSPVNIIATDASGNQTGIFPIAGKEGIYSEKENIPGSTLQVLDDEKYLYLPQNAAFTISLQGYDDGLTTIDFGSTNDETPETSVEFSDVPTTASTTASFTLPSIPEISDASQNNAGTTSVPVAASIFPSTLNVDVLGDGTTIPVSATYLEGSSTAASSTSSSTARIIPQHTAQEIFHVLEGIALRHNQSKKNIDAAFAQFEKDKPGDALQDINTNEKAVETIWSKNLTDSEELFIIELLEELKMTLST